MKHSKDNIDFIVFFDGICNLCNASVHFVNKHDTKKRFKFSSLQSETAENFLNGVEAKNKSNSIVLYHKGKLYFESTAVLKIAKYLRFPVNLLYGFIIIPPFIRNFIYRIIANKRYKWFGKKDKCLITSNLNSDVFI
ncbi:MAG: thiol-disulfide oxidoreductase DCC family protein [Bacteroidota bacterium]